jgi:hypothetical protein
LNLLPGNPTTTKENARYPHRQYCSSHASIVHKNGSR